MTEGRIASKTRDASDKDPSETRPKQQNGS